MNEVNFSSAVRLAASVLLFVASSGIGLAQSDSSDSLLTNESFPAIHRQIRPQLGESHWAGIPWLTDLAAARRKAAAEGKPLFIMASGKGISIGMC